MPAPARVVGHSPYARFSHPPRAVDHRVDGDHPEAVSLFALGAALGFMVGAVVVYAIARLNLLVRAADWIDGVTR